MKISLLTSLRACLALSALLISTKLPAAVSDSPWPSSVPQSEFYDVSITQSGSTTDMNTLVSKPNLLSGPDGTGVTGVLTDRSMSFASFSFTGEIDVTVTKLYGTTAPRVEIQPKAYGIEPYFFDGRTVKFKISPQSGRPAYISVNFVTPDNQDDDGNGGKNIKNALMLFADNPETDIPDPLAPGTVIYSNSLTATQLATADLIYFPAGDHNLLTRYPSNPYRGVLPVGKNGQKIYLAPGAFVRGAVHGFNFDNVRVYGRGIFTGVNQPWHDVRDTAGDKEAFMFFLGSDDCTFEGVHVINPTHHTWPSSNRNTYRNIKVIGWASNHDGLRPASGSLVEQCFIKTSDDYDYARDPHIFRDSVLWPMRNGAFGMLGWNNLGTGFTTYQNLYFINAEWNIYKRNSGIIGSVLDDGVRLQQNRIENIYAEDFLTMLANITIEPDGTVDPANPGEIKNFTFKNVIFENPFKAPNGATIKNRLSGFVHASGTGMIRDIRFINIIAGNTLVTQANFADFFIVDPATTSNITFETEGLIHTVTATANPGGKLSPSGALPTPAGMTRTVAITADPGFRIKNVIVDGNSLGRRQNVSFENISADHTVVVEFEAATNDYFDFGPPPSGPIAPADLVVGSPTPTSLALGWSDLSADETGFRLQRAPAASGPWTNLVDLPANTTGHIDSGLTPTTTYFYRVAAFNASGTSATTAPASGTTPAIPLPPNITTDPASQTVFVGAQVTFNISATGTAPLTYQWFRNNVAIDLINNPSAATASLTLNTVTLVNNGDTYHATVTNSLGSDTSAAATLTVNEIPPVTRPNFLFVAVDDMKTIAGFLSEEPGNLLSTIYPDPVKRAEVRAVLTPNFDRLAARSINFRRATTSVPVCEGSRTALLTGLRPYVSGIYGNTDPYFRDSPNPAVANAITLPQNLRNQGYYTAGTGKIFHGQSASESDAALSWNNWYELGGANSGYVKSPWAPANADGTFDFGSKTNTFAQDADYLKADLLAQALQNGSGTVSGQTLTLPVGQPFFLACGIFRPHGPWRATSDLLALFPAEDIQITRALYNFNQADLSDLSAGGLSAAQFNSSNNEFLKLVNHGKTIDPTNGDLLAWREQIRHYLACVAIADRSLGRLLDGLDASPHRDNTVVVLWSDHGFDLGEKLHLGKLTLWNESAQNLLLIADPARGNTAATCDRTVGLIDLYRTISARAGVVVPNTGIAGNDLARLIANPAAPWGVPAITTYRPGNHALRTDRYTYIRFSDDPANAELYDDQVDPDQVTNLINNPAYAALRADLDALLNQTLAAEPTPLPEDGAPVITSQPQSLTLAAGSTATFTVAATGEIPITYQWFKNGAPIVGNPTATTASLSLNFVSAADVASYTVRVTSPTGNILSSGATLTVTQDQPANLSHYDGFLLDGAPYANATGIYTDTITGAGRNGGTGFGGGWLRQAITGTASLNRVQTLSASALAYRNLLTSGGAARLFARTATPGGTDPTQNFSSVRPLFATPPADGSTLYFSVLFNASAAPQFRLGLSKAATNLTTDMLARIEIGTGTPAPIQLVADTVVQPVAGTNLADGQTHLLVVRVTNHNAPGMTIALWLDPTDLANLGTPNISATPAAPYAFTHFALNGGATASVSFDELRLATASSATFADVLPTQYVPPTAPSITTQPTSLNQNSGTTATFSVAASGTAPLTYQWSKNNSLIDPAANPSAATASLSLNSITTADAASYTVRVTNLAGFATSDAATLTLADAAAAPSNLAATAGPAEVSLTWTDNASNETAQELQYTTDPLAGPWMSVTLPADVTSTTVSGLAENVTYQFRVNASNQAGPSAWSNTASATTLLLPPSAPWALASTAFGDSTVRLNWSDTSSNETGFQLERATSASGPWTLHATISANTNTYFAEGLAAGVTHFFRIRAFHGTGSSDWSNTTSATTTVGVPAAPSSLVASAVSSSQINLTWADNSTNETSFVLQRGTYPGYLLGQWLTLATLPFNTTSYSDTGLLAQKKYAYRIRASSAAGNSTYSNIASITTPAAGLPAPWVNQDIGSVGLPGSAMFASGTFTLNGAGSDIGGNADAFHAVLQPATGDCAITARITSVQNTNPAFKAGVIICETTTSGTPRVYTHFTSGNTIRTTYRALSHEPTQESAAASATLPQWVRVLRIGTTFTSYLSSDGVNWQKVGDPVEITMGSAVQIGLAITSGSAGSLSTVTFSDVSVTP